MSFIGSINDKLRKFFWTYAAVLENRKCYVGCSGNFTIEQILSRRCQNVEIYSNDVSLYSSALGYCLAGKQFEMKVINPELLWAQEFIDRGPAEGVAVLLLLLEMLKYERRSNSYAERMWEAYLTGFEGMLTKTLAKVKKGAESIRIKDYTMIDVFDYYPRPDGISVGFLPTYVGGYEKLFQKLEEAIKWPVPSYAMLTTERREATITKMTEGDYILYDDVDRELPCVARVDLFGHKTVFIYSNLDIKTGLFTKKINEKVVPYKLLMPDDEILEESSISFKMVDLNTLNHYRNMYLSKKIQPGSGGPCFLAFVDGRLFGFIIFQGYSKRGGADDEIYLLSDFVVPSNRYRRLAKLLLMAVLCRENKQRLEEMFIRKYSSILTTAFTENPVSMKYRGVFELAKRGKGFLNYRGLFTDDSLKEVVSLWKQKYGKQ